MPKIIHFGTIEIPFKYFCDITCKDWPATYENDLLGRVAHPYNVSTVASGFCVENDN